MERFFKIRNGTAKENIKQCIINFFHFYNNYKGKEIILKKMPRWVGKDTPINSTKLAVAIGKLNPKKNMSGIIKKFKLINLYRKIIEEEEISYLGVILKIIIERCDKTKEEKTSRRVQQSTEYVDGSANISLLIQIRNELYHLENDGIFGSTTF